MPKARSVTNPQKSGSVTNPVKLVLQYQFYLGNKVKSKSKVKILFGTKPILSQIHSTRGHYFWMGSCGSCNEMTKRVVR